MKWRYSDIASIIIIILIVALFIPDKARAAAPTAVHIFSGRSFALTYSTKLGFNGDIFADKVFSLLNRVNFTNAAYSTNTGAVQSFGTAQSGAGVRSSAINAINANNVEFIVTYTSGNPYLYFYYKMPNSNPWPPSVVIGSSTIQDSNYFTSASSFNSCATPCVYLNSSNKTMIARMLPSAASPATIDFWYVRFNGGGSSGSGNPAVTTTSATTAIATTAAATSAAATSAAPSPSGSSGGNFPTFIPPTPPIQPAPTLPLPIYIPPAVGNPDLNAVAEVVVVAILAMTLTVSYFGRPAKKLGAKTKQPDLRSDFYRKNRKGLP